MLAITCHPRFQFSAAFHRPSSEDLSSAVGSHLPETSQAQALPIWHSWHVAKIKPKSHASVVSMLSNAACRGVHQVIRCAALAIHTLADCTLLVKLVWRVQGS